MRALTRIALLVTVLVGWSGGAAAQPVVVRGGTLIDVRDGRLMEDVTVVIDGDRIVSVTQGGTAPAGATVLDAKGKYILPGLMDLHVHYKEWAPELYLNHGVTTVVSLGDTYQWIRAQKEGVEKGLIPGPRIFHSTENLDGEPEDMGSYFVRPHVRLLKGPEDARRAMREYVAEGIDAVKVYDGLGVEHLKAIAAEAEKGDIPVIGHFEDVRIAAEIGANGIEHLAALANAVMDKQARAEAMKKVRTGFRPPADSFMDPAKLPDIVKLMVSKNLYLNPTMRMSWQGDRALREKGFHYEDFDLLINDWRLRYIPLGFRLADLKEFQEIGVWHWQDLSQYEQDLFHQGYVNAQKMIKAFVDAGGKLYAGTDSANMCVPGLSMHQELELLVDAGVTPLAALQAATINPATLMRMTDRLGTVEAGKVGDMVIVDANPLENIRNTRKIWRVISRGKVLDGQYTASFVNPIPKSDPEQSSHFFPSPRIKTASPVMVAEGASGVKLTVEGTGFIPYSFVRWDDAKLPTTFVDEDKLEAAVPPELLKGGTYSITVENPDFAGGSIFARGASDIGHLGIRDNISNAFKVMVKFAPTPATAPSGK